MCEEWQAAAPNITVVVPANEPMYGYGYRHYCDDPYDSRCKVQLDGGGFYGGIYGGGVRSPGVPYGEVYDYYPHRDPRTGKVTQKYGPVGGYGGRRGGRWMHRRRKAGRRQ